MSRQLICGSILTCEISALIFSNFDFPTMGFVAWKTLVFSVVSFMVLLPFFGYALIRIVNEQIEETKQTVSQKNFYQKMFNSMQEGICTIEDGKIIFMNDLCNTFTSNLSGLRDFE